MNSVDRKLYKSSSNKNNSRFSSSHLMSHLALTNVLVWTVHLIKRGQIVNSIKMVLLVMQALAMGHQLPLLNKSRSYVS